MGWSSGSTGGGVDPTQLVPKTRTINGKALDNDVILKLIDISNESGVSLDVLINDINDTTDGLGNLNEQLSNKVTELERAIELGVNPEDLKPITDSIAALKQSIQPKEIAVPWYGGWGPYNNVGHCQIQKVGNVVCMSIRASNRDVNRRGILIALPPEFRPRAEIECAGKVTTSVFEGITIDKNGYVNINKGPVPDKIFFTVSYFV
ncbi:hypothetical protein RJD40_01640 [Vibrio scophthalmi]|uniref:hypothetical protein n=1 Tax=Vibrio scophthalmi TaxID=45658 RepID=UPI003AAAA0E8